jgi:hypothetical protein
MINKTLMALLAGTLGCAATLATSIAWAEVGQFSLSSGFSLSPGDYGTADTSGMLSTPVIGKYETGPWVFKLTVPATGGTGSIGRIRAGSNANSIQSGFGDTVAAATYSIYAGNASAFGVDLTGKVKLGLADKFYGLNSGQNDYAAQADAYQNFDKFKALGSLGYKIQGDATGISMNRMLYGSVGGAYQLNTQMSGGVDFSLSQSPTALDQGQRQLSAYVSQSINKSFKAKGYILKDFSNSSPDHSVGAAVTYGF